MGWAGLSKRGKMRRIAVALLITPTILFVVPLLGLLDDPSLLSDYWTFYVLFLGVPYISSAGLWIISRRV